MRKVCQFCVVCSFVFQITSMTHTVDLSIEFFKTGEFAVPESAKELKVAVFVLSSSK